MQIVKQQMSVVATWGRTQKRVVLVVARELCGGGAFFFLEVGYACDKAAWGGCEERVVEVGVFFGERGRNHPT